MTLSAQIEPPEDNFELVDKIVEEACRRFINFNDPDRKFSGLYDIMYEEVRENLHKYVECYERN